MNSTIHSAAPRLRVISLLLLSITASSLAAPPATRPDISKAEADKLIDDAGKKPPDWWDSVTVRTPPSLDLTWKTVPGWQPQKNLGAYLWDIIYPNPSRWREGVKMLHQTLQINKGNKDGLDKSISALANNYAELLQDFSRAAYWAKKSGDHELLLAECYWKIGCKPAAVDLLEQMLADTTRNGQAIKLWAEMGDLKTALEWANEMADMGMASPAYLAAAEACRHHGKTDEAIKYYQKVLTVSDGSRQGDIKQNKARARASLEAIRLFDKLDLSKVPDGSYKSDSIGYVGPVEVTVTVKKNRIEKIEITNHKEKQFYASLTEIPQRIIAKQGVKGIDMTTGATITSEAIVNATAKALAGAQK